MKKKQTINLAYDATKSNTPNVVEEPFAPYFTNHSSVSTKSTFSKTLDMMGIGNVKQYAYVNNEGDFITVIRNGLPKLAMDKMVLYTGISSVEMAEIIRISDRTLRRYTKETVFNPEQTERLIEIAKLYARGEEVFGSLAQFNHWMSSEILALGNKKPKAFLDTSIGIQILLDELGKIEHGIFA